VASTDEVERLLAEIRDLQREHLEEYRRVSARSLEYQERATRVQAEAVAKQRIGLWVVTGMLAALVVYLLAVAGR